MRILALLLILVSILSCNKGKNNPEACNGDTRRDVKLLLDVGVMPIDTTILVTTVTELGELDVPEVKAETERQELEHRTYRVTAVVDKVKHEPDGDWHIRLKEGDNYLITECPNPDCRYAESSPYVATYRRIKELIENNELEGKTVTITGIAFIDIDHHYKRKQAKNNIELHPILELEF